MNLWTFFVMKELQEMVLEADIDGDGQVFSDNNSLQ